jgi:hypothetical protein
MSYKGKPSEAAALKVVAATAAEAQAGARLADEIANDLTTPNDVCSQAVFYRDMLLTAGSNSKYRERNRPPTLHPLKV